MRPVSAILLITILCAPGLGLPLRPLEEASAPTEWNALEMPPGCSLLPSIERVLGGMTPRLACFAALPTQVPTPCYWQGVRRQLRPSGDCFAWTLQAQLVRWQV